MNRKQNLYAGKIMSDGRREIVDVVKMKDLGSEQEIFIRSIGGAIVKVEGPLAQSLRGNNSIPFGMVNTPLGLEAVTKESVLLFDPADPENVTRVLGEDFFDAHYTAYEPKPEESAQKEHEDFASILNRFLAGEELNDEEFEIMATENARRSGR